MDHRVLFAAFASPEAAARHRDEVRSLFDRHVA